ncbi:Adenylate kinase 7, partial [Taenia solium]
ESDKTKFYDVDYIRRKAHRHYSRHIAAEKEIKRLGTLNKFKFLTYVIASGITYGEENDIFHPFLKALYKLLNLCPTTHYILAVDDGYNTLLEIVTQKHIDGLTSNLRLEAQFVHENLPFKWVSENGMVESMARIVKEFKLARGLLPIRICVLGPPLSGKSKLAQLLSEYYSVTHVHVKGVIEARIKDLEEQVNSGRKKTSGRVEDNEEAEEEASDEDYDAANDGDQNPSALLKQIKATLSSEKGRLSNAMVCRQEHKQIYSLGVRKLEFILTSDTIANDDEAVEEMEETEEINEGTVQETTKVPDPQVQVAQLNRERAARERSIPNMTAETDFLGKVALSPNPNSLPKGILPACVIFLQATDAFLFNRVLKIPNDEVRCSHNDEEGFLRRLFIYRHAHAGSEVAALMASDELRKALNSEYLKRITAGEASTLTSTEQVVPLMAGSIGTNTLCAFFEDRGVRAFNFDVETDTSGVFNEIEQKIRTAIGPPRNYGPTSKTVTIRGKMRLKEEEERRELEKAREAEEFRRHEACKREFSDLLERVRTEEDEALLKASKPLREFLAKFIMPTLSKGIFECIWRRPEDPIDYLAEYLFRNNEQVD